MNYQRLYDNIISSAKTRNLLNNIECHHIIPKCIGGSNRSSNLVNLTPKEHYIAHHLLYKIYQNSSTYIKKKMAHAWLVMCHINTNGIRYKVSSNQYNSAKLALIQSYSDHKIYTFVHRNRTIFSGTRTEFLLVALKKEKIDLSALINRKKIIHGWILLDNVYDDFYYRTYTLSNGINIVTGYKHEFKELIDIDSYYITLLENRSNYSCKGYHITHIDDNLFDNNTTTNTTNRVLLRQNSNNQIAWYHHKFGYITKSVREISIENSIPIDCLNLVVSHEKLHTRGWIAVSGFSAAYANFSIAQQNKIEYCYIAHTWKINSKIIIGTICNISETYNINKQILIKIFKEDISSENIKLISKTIIKG